MAAIFSTGRKGCWIRRTFASLRGIPLLSLTGATRTVGYRLGHRAFASPAFRVRSALPGRLAAGCLPVLVRPARRTDLPVHRGGHAGRRRCGRGNLPTAEQRAPGAEFLLSDLLEKVRRGLRITERASAWPGSAKSFQNISFPIPATGGPLAGIRLAPSDRPGYLAFHGMRLFNSRDDCVTGWRYQRTGEPAS